MFSGLGLGWKFMTKGFKFGPGLVISKDKSFSRFYFRITAQIITNDAARRQENINHGSEKLEKKPKIKTDILQDLRLIGSRNSCVQNNNVKIR